MSNPFAGWSERVLDLAIGHGTEGLDDAELSELRGATSRADLQEFERSIAAIHLASLRGLEPPPGEVMERLLGLAENTKGDWPH